ncbi:acetyl-CoA hydrolase/transferase C-terminal domain-containing protein [uncultured Desulfosarcina sp.]|uniref:acetyl-CoA hydrolase/transferase family protein n=1 Tax=uncultured Desulfosarcina sp. TaxID=218289 RepID=UPI0029C8DE08|nr:acetyl-CoA hydrolase/transferase C-terminal domain-containing protein [uncultured Desulfosarcina sp.]
MNAENSDIYYRSRIMSADEAVQIIKSGDRVIDGHGAGQPTLLREAMVRKADELENVEVICGFALGESEYCQPEYQGSFIFNSVFNMRPTRQAHWEGRAEFTPAPFSELDRLFTTRLLPDVLFIQVTPPNKQGYVSMGISVDYTRAVVDYAKVVIAQVNKNMPWTYGDALIHVTDIDRFVLGDIPLHEIPIPKKISKIEKSIAKHIASLINDGDTIQTGVGAIPDTVISLLSNHKNIGIHTELASTGIMKMIEKGVINNSKKSIDKGKVVCTMLGGTKEFYNYVDQNPSFELRRSGYVNNPLTIAKQKNMVAMNSAIQVDLLGQVCADMIGPKQFSGVGGQLDFFRGASMADNGKSIVCMPSTAANGTVSRIVPFLDAGAAITDTRYDVMYIVTEYGIADLWGRTNSQRAKELIKIAHPDFQEELEKEYYEKILMVA